MYALQLAAGLGETHFEYRFAGTNVSLLPAIGVYNAAETYIYILYYIFIYIDT